MNETLIAFILGIIVIFLAARLLFYKSQIKSLSDQLRFIESLDTNLEITTQISAKQIKMLVRDINTLIRRHKKYKSEIRHTSGTFKQTITSVSHDLRTPLTSIAGYIKMLESESLPEEKRREYILAVKNRMESVRRLIDQLFEYARIEAGEFTLSVSRVNFTNIVLEKLSMFYDNFSEKGMEVSVNAQKAPLFVDGDSDALERVVENIVINALVHGKETLLAELCGDGHFARLVLENATDEISDTDTELIFERFYTTDRSRTKKSTGLGLSIAKQLTIKMGGSISAFLKDGRFGIEVLIPLSQKEKGQIDA